MNVNCTKCTRYWLTICSCSCWSASLFFLTLTNLCVTQHCHIDTVSIRSWLRNIALPTFRADVGFMRYYAQSCHAVGFFFTLSTMSQTDDLYAIHGIGESCGSICSCSFRLLVSLLSSIKLFCKQNWNQFLFVVKTTALKQQIQNLVCKFNAQTLAVRLLACQRPLTNVKASFKNEKSLSVQWFKLSQSSLTLNPIRTWKFEFLKIQDRGPFIDVMQTVANSGLQKSV